MSKHAGERRARKRGRVPTLGWVAIAIALGLSTLTAAVVVTNVGDDGNDTTAPAVGAASPGRDGSQPSERVACPDASTVGVPQAYLAAWQSALGGFEPDSACRTVSAIAAPSAAVALGKGPAVDAWIPEDATWIARAGKGQWKGKPPQPTPVARTPVVVATTADLDAAVGGIQKVLVPPVFGPLVRETRSFGDWGRRVGLRLRTALPEPATTAACPLGFAALTQAATGTPLTAVPAYVNPTEQDLTTIKTEHRVVTVGSDEATVLADLDPSSRGKANLVVTTEQAALAHNDSPAGTDNPLGVGYLGVDLTMALVPIEPAAQPLVDAVGAFLTSSDGKAALSAAGLRPAQGADAPNTSGAIQPAAYSKPGSTATAEQVTALTSLFGAMHQRISALVVLDASGSMLQPLPGGDASKIDLVRRAARDTLRVASPQARSGLMTFRSDGKDRPVITTPVPLAANGSRSDGRLHSRTMMDAVNGLDVDGGTPLYNAVRAAYRAAVRAYDPDMINQVVVLSDGRNEDAVGSISLPTLVNTLRSVSDPDRPVRIIAIGYGPDADIAALDRIVSATNGRASWLRSVDGYSDAVQEALFAP